MTKIKDSIDESSIRKVARRGISNETRAVTRIKFHEKDCVPANGLFIGHLESVSVDISNSDKIKAFPNMDVPRLVFHFESNHAKQSERRYYGHTIWPVESSIDTIPGGRREAAVNNVLNIIKHFLDVFYLNGRELTIEEEEALTLDFIDYDETGAYIPVKAEEVLASYRKIFENAAAMLNGTFGLEEGETPKPCYKTADGKFIPIWMKLLRHVKNRDGEWKNVGLNGDLAFSLNIGSGLIEKVNGQNPPVTLRINFARESITPKNTEVKKPTLAGVTTGISGTIIANNVPIMGAQQNDAYISASEDEMPF